MSSASSSSRAAAAGGRIELEVLGAGRCVGRSCVLATFTPRRSTSKPPVRILLDCGANVGCGDPLHDESGPDQSDESSEETDDEMNDRNALRTTVLKSIAKHHHKVPKLDHLWRGQQPSSKSKTGMLPIDAILVTHFHLDHTGALPYLTEILMESEARQPEIFMSLMTKLTAPMMLKDYVKDQKPALYCPCHVEACFTRAKVMAPGERKKLACGALVTAYPAGHVVGALMFMIEYGGMTLFYTGDFSTQAEFTMPPANLMTRQLPLTGKVIDAVISEATFGSSVHLSSRLKEASLCDTICGKSRLREYLGMPQGVPPLITIMPVFATSRVSEMAQMFLSYYKREILNKDLLDSLPIKAAGAAAGSAFGRPNGPKSRRLSGGGASLPPTPDLRFFTTSSVTYMCNEYYRRLSLGLAEGDTGPMGAMAAASTAARVELIDDNFVFPPNCISVVFCGAAMMEGGASLSFFNRENGNPDAQFVLTGYCRNGTVGNELISIASQADKRRKVDETQHPPRKRPKWSPTVNYGDGRKLAIRCKPYYVPMTYHTDSYGVSQLVAGLRPSKKVVLVHSEYKRMKALQDLLEFRLGVPVECPETGTKVVIDCDQRPAPD
ncbi:hypothetical protein FOL47_004345 [Perkinsus chesapeaki]|uniref:Metallo-beta-lactamase domain-containing protein n=1 Tax=Perkinsus chesapeaki TaxID=330153 RepID=A0A7J6M3A9_PERCH|nr:hypothetical protein FOL47_004345 [Perkinsus chesapeaki]